MKVFLTNNKSIADGMNYLGVMPGPKSLCDFQFFCKFKPVNGGASDYEYQINNIRINNTHAVNDERWNINAKLIFNSPESDLEKYTIAYNHKGTKFKLSKEQEHNGITSILTPDMFI